MTAAGVVAVTVEWGRARPADGAVSRCGCRPVLLAAWPSAALAGGAAGYVALVHETDPVRPVRCPSSLPRADEHLRAGPECVDPGWRGCADVLCSDAVLPGPAALRAVRRALREHPGCLLGGVRLRGGGCVALSRDGRCLLARGSVLTTREHGGIASLLHGWVASGVQLPGGGRSRLLIRSRSRRVSLGLTER